MNAALGLLIWILACFLPAAAGAFFRPGEWYSELAKPTWTPPGSWFGPVWTVLYLTMGVAAWLVWRRSGWQGARFALALFLFQLVLNGLWSWLFFGLRSPLAGLVDIVVLWLAIGVTILAFRRHSAGASLLLVPYLAWVTFATALNFALWRLNG